MGAKVGCEGEGKWGRGWVRGWGKGWWGRATLKHDA